jgi:hypothetical protein
MMTRKAKGLVMAFPTVFNNMTAPSTNLTVGGFPIELQSTHPQSSLAVQSNT